MLGRQHLMLSLATVSIVFAPLLENYIDFVLVMFVGAGIGSLIPDIDAQDAAIFHTDLRGLNSDLGGAVNNLIGPILPYFGYTTKYAIYKPAVKVFDHVTSDSYSFEEKHRTFSHSITGVLTMTILTGVYLTPMLILFELFAPIYLLSFLGAYMTGAFLHMLEDSCTKTGIAWNSPFSQTKLKGEISTGKDNKKPRYFLYWLGALTATTIYLTTFTENTPRLPVNLTTSIAAATLSWVIFFKIICKGKITKN